MEPLYYHQSASLTPRRRRMFAFVAVVLASLIASTAVYVNLLAWSDATGVFQLRMRSFYDAACDAVVGSSSSSFALTTADNDDLADFLLRGFNSTSPNHAACLAFEASAVGRNCSRYLAGNGQHDWNIKNSDLLDFKRVLLISHFNFPTYKAAAKVDALYRNIFADIYYCGPTYEPGEFWMATNASMTNDTLSALRPEAMKFLAYGIPLYNSAENFYRCLILVAKVTELSDYKGVLLMSDDMILNVWRLKAAGKTLEKNWMMQGDVEDAFEIDEGTFCYKNSSKNDEDCHRKDVYWLWTGVYRQGLLTMYEELETLAGDYSLKKPKNSRKYPGFADYDIFTRTAGAERFFNENPAELDGRAFWRWIRVTLQRKTGGKRRVFGRASGDCFFVTQRYLRPAIRFFQLLDRHRIFMEIAVGTVLKTISLSGDLQFLDITAHDWGQNRGRPINETYGTNFELVHPFKLGTLHRRKTGDTCVFCNILKLTHSYANLVHKPCLLAFAPNKTLERPSVVNVS